MSYSDFTTASLDEIYAEGKRRGLSFGGGADMPQAGDRCYVDDGSLVEVSDTATLEEAMLYQAYNAENHGRDYSPFEFIADAINQRGDSEQAWEKYSAGIDAGIKENIEARIAAVASYWFNGEEA